MIASESELFSVLRQYNPWWGGGIPAGLPGWRRAAFGDFLTWVTEPPAHRAILLSGARQVGKTTLMLQSITELLRQGVKGEQILYATFDHPLLKLAGLEEVLRVWHDMQGPHEGPQYLMLDEIQSVKDWGVWLKHQVDFRKNARIAVTGSAIPITVEDRESGVGRWHTIKLQTLSFLEYLQIKGAALPPLPSVGSLAEVADWPGKDRIRAGEEARTLVTHFHEYLLRGGFPQTALVDDITTAQNLVREDILDKVIKRDMTAFFGVRRVLELEKLFLYLCLHDGGILDLPTLCSNLELKKPTVSNFLDLLEAAHLVRRLRPYGYGKEVLRGRYKIYLSDPAIAGSVLLKGKDLLGDRIRLGAAVETAVVRHILGYYDRGSAGFSYWRGKRDLEVDVVAEIQGQIIPFEVKFQEGRVDLESLKGLRAFCREKALSLGYVITRDMSDFEVIADSQGSQARGECRFLKIPAPLACLWLSGSP